VEKAKLLTMTGPIARIMLRYGSGAMLSIGLIDPDMAEQISGDSDLVVVLSLCVGVVIELAYTRAKLKGQPT